MKVNATTHDDGLRLTLTISGPEVADAFASACKDYRMRDAIMKIMFDQSAPLAQAIAEQVKIAIESPQSQANLRLAIDRGLAAAITIERGTERPSLFLTFEQYEKRQRREMAEKAVHSATYGYSWACKLSDEQLNAIAEILKIEGYRPC